MQDTTILITGANRGIGLELATQFAAHGWNVFACCRDPDNADELATLSGQYPQLEVMALDVTDYAQMARLSAQLHDRPIDVLLSNAGIYGPKGVGFGEVDPADWREVLEVNTVAPLMLAQAFVEQVAASRQKLIAVIGSKMGSIAGSKGGSYIYRSSKTAVNQLVKSMSIDLAGRGISVISLHPGWVQTDMGGPDADVTIADSAAGLRGILETAGSAQNGAFVDYNGEPLPW